MNVVMTNNGRPPGQKPDGVFPDPGPQTPDPKAFPAAQTSSFVNFFTRRNRACPSKNRKLLGNNNLTK